MQAHNLAQVLLSERLDQIWCGPLKRHLQFGQIVSEKTQVSCLVKNALLNELDFGIWGGKTRQQIQLAFPFFTDRVFDDWEQRRIWPKVLVQEEGRSVVVEPFGAEATFLASTLELIESLKVLLAGSRLVNLSLLWVTSNVRVHFIMKVLGQQGMMKPGAKSGDAFVKMAPGSITLLDIVPDADFGLKVACEYWGRKI
jgi:broad specificity phosphatase PhoE